MLELEIGLDGEIGSNAVENWADFINFSFLWMSDFFAGLVAGTASCYVGHPFDTVKTLLQLSPEKYQSSAQNCVRTVVKEHGARALYRGVTLPVVCSSISNGLIFQVSEKVYTNLNTDPATKERGFNQYRFLSGVCAGFAQSFIAAPFELVKCRMQFMRVRHMEALTRDGKRHIVQDKNLESFSQIARKLTPSELAHSGLLYTILRDAPAFGLYFYCFHGIKTTYDLREPCQLSDLATLDTWILAVTGGLCGCIGWIVSYPIDVLKSQKQVYGRTPRVDKLKAGWWYRGLAPTLLRTIPVNMVRFIVYLFVKNNLE